MAVNPKSLKIAASAYLDRLEKVMTNSPDARDADVMAVANAFRQVLKDNFPNDFSSTMAAMQAALAMSMIDLTVAQQMTAKQREAVYMNFGQSLRVAYDLMRNPPQEKK